MIIDIPKSNNWTQGNDGELFGTLSRTFNVDLEQERGKLTLSRRMNVNTTVADEAGLTRPTSFAFHVDRYWAVAGGTIYKSDSDTGGDPSVEMSPDDSTGTPTGLTSDDDLVVFNGDIYSLTDDIFKKDTGTHATDWTDTTLNLNNSFHTSCVYGNRLYVSNLGDEVNSIDTSDVMASPDSSNALSLKREELEISDMEAASDGIWIATVNTAGGRAEVFKWDGTTENTVDASYIIPDVSVKSLIVFNDRPYIITGRGLVMTFNGAFFEEVARFPWYYNVKSLYQRADRDGWVHDNSMAVVDNKIHIVVGNKPLDGELNDNNRSYAGVWVLDEQFGLYHKYAFYTAGSTSSNITQQIDIATPGAIYPSAVDENQTDFEQVGKFITGAEYYSDATTTTHGIFSVQSRYEEGNAGSYSLYPDLGWFVTPQIQAEQVTEAWNDIVITFKKLANSTDKIVVKARSNEDAYLDGNITWTSTTTFTTTDTDFATVKTNFDVGIDQEVTILRGKGAGMCSHISAITESGGTYTVTVDETHTGATSGTAKARVEKWNKLGSITDSNNELTWERFAVGLDGTTWAQFKVFLLGKGTSPTIERLISVSTPKNTYQ